MLPNLFIAQLIQSSFHEEGSGFNLQPSCLTVSICAMLLLLNCVLRRLLTLIGSGHLRKWQSERRLYRESLLIVNICYRCAVWFQWHHFCLWADIIRQNAHDGRRDWWPCETGYHSKDSEWHLQPYLCNGGKSGIPYQGVLLWDLYGQNQGSLRW